MSQLERLYKLDRMLRRKQPPKKAEVLATFEISPAQFKRDLEFMRDRLWGADCLQRGDGDVSVFLGRIQSAGALVQ